MSMILDALQRADRERQKHDQPVPSLETPTAKPPVRETVPRGPWLWMGGGIALALAMVAVFLTVNPPSSPEVAGPSATLERPASTPPTPSPEQTNAQAPSQTPPEVQSQAPSDGTAAKTPADEKPPAIARLYQSPQEEDASVRALYRATPASPSPEPSARPTDATAETTPEPPAPATASVRDLPWNLQQTMPSLNYQRHDYRGGAASRVRINGKEHQAGQQVAPDLTLERIEEDGAVMRYRGHQFKLKALNSWVNM